VALIIGLSITFVVAVAFFFFSAIVTRPLMRMQHNMEVITKDLSFADDNEHLSHLSEVDSMQRSFFRLKKGLLSFSRYVPLSVVRLLIANNASAELGVEPCEATSFFSDIAGFTTISEAYSPPVLMAVLEEYFDSMSKIISDSSGVVGDYIGDAIFAFWNTPVPVARHPFLACTAALAQQRRLAEMRSAWATLDRPVLHVRMGMSLGQVSRILMHFFYQELFVSSWCRCWPATWARSSGSSTRCWAIP
jgi:adenylate cyclase